MDRVLSIDWGRYHEVALDTETTGLHFMRDEVFGFSISHPEGGYYFDIRREPESVDWLRDFVLDFDGRIVFHNSNFDIKFLRRIGVVVPFHKVEDTAIMAALCDEHRSTAFPWRKGLKKMGYSLDSLLQTYVPNRRKRTGIYQELADIFGGQATPTAQMPNLHAAPIEVASPYAIDDTDGTLALFYALREEIERQDLHKVLAFEYSVLPQVIEQEMAGVRVDLDRAHMASTELLLEIDREKAKLNSIVGREFNVNSTPQIREHYSPRQNEDGSWVLGDGTPCGTTDTGNPSINAPILQALAGGGDSVATQIIKVRSLIRTRDTFLETHVIGSSVAGRVYPTINQVSKEAGGTSTGRFSYVGPALQQIPNRNKSVAKIVKSCFLPDEGHVWLDGDLNSFEVRVFAHLVARYNPAIQRIYEDDPMTDFHQMVADLMRVPRNPQPQGGANAKQLNLSMIFHAGIGSIAHQLGMRTELDEFEDEWGTVIKFHRPVDHHIYNIIEHYHKNVPGVKDLIDQAQHIVDVHGYVKTVFGRKLRFPRGYKKYKASGIVIQATAADVNKNNWNIIDEALDGRGRMILNTHDSYSLSVPEDRVDETWTDVAHAVQTKNKLRVPIVLEKSGHGNNWWEAISQ